MDFLRYLQELQRLERKRNDLHKEIQDFMKYGNFNLDEHRVVRPPQSWCYIEEMEREKAIRDQNSTRRYEIRCSLLNTDGFY